MRSCIMYSFAHIRISNVSIHEVRCQTSKIYGGGLSWCIHITLPYHHLHLCFKATPSLEPQYFYLCISSEKRATAFIQSPHSFFGIMTWYVTKLKLGTKVQVRRSDQATNEIKENYWWQFWRRWWRLLRSQFCLKSLA